ncbi:hypothetical protein B0A49_03271 [Cryomyces minteri]|uniref:SnoaL-like domain-containing protein n=1 Tax=Cryomyces minteri TaxID=331657 RepID=A0A4U0XE40_9PEZI|nr:hypothetical protein B0A49_03271 [Cryomyces minteri]
MVRRDRAGGAKDAVRQDTAVQVTPQQADLVDSSAIILHSVDCAQNTRFLLQDYIQILLTITAMTLALTVDEVRSILEPAARGEWAPFMEAVDAEVRWVIGSEEKSAANMTGTYNLASWQSEVAIPLAARLDGLPKMKIESLTIAGQTAIAECFGSATQKNGRPYHNRSYVWFLKFSPESGKIIEIREYLDTALVREVNLNNELANKEDGKG